MGHLLGISIFFHKKIYIPSGNQTWLLKMDENGLFIVDLPIEIGYVSLPESNPMIFCLINPGMKQKEQNLQRFELESGPSTRG